MNKKEITQIVRLQKSFCSFHLKKIVVLKSSVKKVMGGFYAVRVGRRQGVYRNWADCKEQVEGVSGAKFKKFNSLEEAQDFVDGG